MVGSVAVLKPRETRAEMFGNAEGQSLFLRGLLPDAYHVAVRSVVYGIPFMQLGIPQEKIIVVDAHAHEVARAGFFIKRHQLFRLPLLGFPQPNNVLPAIRGRMRSEEHTSE